MAAVTCNGFAAQVIAGTFSYAATVSTGANTITRIATDVTGNALTKTIMRRRRTKWAWSGYPFRTGQREVRNVGSYRKRPGSKTASADEPGAKDASARSSDCMDSRAAAVTEWNAALVGLGVIADNLINLGKRLAPTLA